MPPWSTIKLFWGYDILATLQVYFRGFLGTMGKYNKSVESLQYIQFM